MLRFLALLLCLTWLAAARLPAVAQSQAPDAEAQNGEAADGPSGLALPRFVSLRSPEVNVRSGPGTRYPIDWVYRRRNLPVEIIDEFDTWRRIRDWEGTLGWVHQSMLQSRRTVLVGGEGATVRRDPQDDARPVARLEPGVIANLESCGALWCVVAAEDARGWLRRDQVYGVYPDETIP